MSAPEPKEIREAFRDYRSDWKDIHEESAADMQAISVEGPWTSEDRQERDAKGRPCVHLDQINQFLNQVIGNVRKSKRAIKAQPKGNGASDQDAERRGSLIMGIEERSQAQPIYLYAFECMIQRSYGFARITTEYDDDSSFDQSIWIKPVQNPDTVLFSPHYKQPDASDVPEAFFLDRIPKRDFTRKFPHAKTTDFSGEIMGEQHVSDWITEHTVQVAENWRIEKKRSKLLLIEIPGRGPQIFTEEEWKEASKLFSSRGEPVPETKRDRMIETPEVKQYLTNGIEILDTVDWAGTRIPIIACFGPERWTNNKGKAKRELLSMVRFARDPQMLYDYLATQECEEAKMTPKAPFVGAVGQFETDKESWENVSEDPRAFVQYDPVTDATGQTTLPPPSRPQYAPNFQQYELAKDAAGRALQAAMGITPLPSAAQRRNEKSGVALEKIDDMESLGSFHFIDRYESCFLHNLGWQVNHLITPIYDTKREMSLPLPDGQRRTIQIVGQTSHPIEVNTGQYDQSELEQEHMHTAKGDFDVTISTGPSYDSERDEQSQFVDQLIQNLANLPQPGTPQAKVLALGIRMRPTLGPIGKQIADVFDPPDPSNLPPEAQAAIQQMQSQLQLLQQENAALHADRAGRVLEQQTKMALEDKKQQGMIAGKKWDYITRVVVAELAKGSKADEIAARLAADKELALLGFTSEHIDRAHDAAHEFAMQRDQQSHASDLASQAAQNHPAAALPNDAQPA